MFKFLILAIFFSSIGYCNSIIEIAESYFKSSEYYRMVMSPSGKYLAAETYYDAQEHIEIVDIDNKKSHVVFDGTNGVTISISDIQWIDDDSIIVQFSQLKSSTGISIFKVIHLDITTNTSVKSSFEFKKKGFIIDNLPKVSNTVYFAHILSGEKYTSGAYRVNFSNIATMKRDFHFVNKIASSIRKPFYWLLDENKKIRMILSEQGKKVYYWLLDNKRWIKVFTTNEDSDDFIYPQAINSDNELIVVKREKNKDKKGVYILNAKNLKSKKELFYSKYFDVTSIETNTNTSDLTTIRYVKNGIVNDVLIDDKLLNAENLLIKKYSKFNRIYIASNKNYSKHLFLLHNFENEGKYIMVNTEKQLTLGIVDKASWRNPLEKGKLEIIEYKNDDGMIIESYLSLPKSKIIRALLVMPHGGPIGVRSYGYFDSLSHFLAFYGIAVLKINYRGSSGFGKKFQDSGKKQWGTKIEKDINDVVTFTLEKFKLDKTNICSAGSSYGGYSALMLHINYPKRYKCIISVAGPTDLPLMFTSSDWNINKDAIKLMTEIVGDPHHDIEKLKAQSPLYNAKKIHAPVLLIHGTDDPRVNIEHSNRLEYILKKLKKPVELIKVNGAKHGFYLLENQVLYAVELLKFINKALRLNINFEENTTEH